MDIEALRNKIHEMIDKIEDESTLNIIMEDAALYTSSKTTPSIDEELTAEQWTVIESAQKQIKAGQFKTYEEVKEHFAQWLTK